MTIAVDADAESIIGDIHDAFRGVRRGEITLHEAVVLDEYGTPEARDEARQRDTEERWEQLPDTHVEECGWALCHVDPQSWQYYIAPLMIWSLRYFRSNDDSVVPDFTIYTFDPNVKHEDLRSYKLDRHRLLDDAQARCVCRFLRYMAQHGDRADDFVANDALRKYWGRFCEPNDP